MPELPEVTTTVNGLNKTVKNLTIRDVWSDYYKNSRSKSKETIKNKKYFDKFREQALGQKITNITRRGKNILIEITGGNTILIHMKMTGHLLYGTYTWNKKAWSSKDKYLTDPYNQFLHLVFTFHNKKHLAFSDVRKFAKVVILRTDEVHTKHLSDLGPEPLNNMSLQTFTSQIQKKLKWKIKSVLMDQTIIAGIGNIYSDEILWESGVLPYRLASSISNKEMKKMWSAMTKILEKSIEMGGDSMSDYRNIYGERGNFQNAHKVYRKTKEVCQKKGCGGIIEKKIIGGRSSHFCPQHQI